MLNTMVLYSVIIIMEFKLFVGNKILIDLLAEKLVRAWMWESYFCRNSLFGISGVVGANQHYIISEHNEKCKSFHIHKRQRMFIWRHPVQNRSDDCGLRKVTFLSSLTLLRFACSQRHLN